MSVIYKAILHQAGKPDDTPTHLKNSERTKDQSIEFSPFFVGIDRRRISSGQAAAFVHRQEARMVSKMLADKAESVAKVNAKLEQLESFQKAGEKPALFHQSRKEYQSNLSYAKRHMKLAIEEGFRAYVDYQDHYGFGDAFSEDYDPKDVKDLRPKDIRIALNPLAMKLKNYLNAVSDHLNPLNVENRQLAKDSGPHLSKLRAVVGQINYELERSQSQVASLRMDYQGRIDSALDKREQLDEMADLAKKSASTLLAFKSSPTKAFPHQLQDISLDKVEALLK